MAHVDLPHDGAGDLAGAGTVFKNRAFVYLWSAQALSQLASNMVLAALMATVRRTTGSDTAVAVLILTFLVPAVLFSTLGGVLVERSNAKTDHARHERHPGGRDRRLHHRRADDRDRQCPARVR